MIPAGNNFLPATGASCCDAACAGLPFAYGDADGANDQITILN